MVIFIIDFLIDFILIIFMDYLWICDNLWYIAYCMLHIYIISMVISLLTS